MLRTPPLAAALSGIERSWIPEQQRARLLGGFAVLSRLAAERDRGPKVVFDHILAPHMPVVFSKTGDPVPPLPCFPVDCDLSDFGDRYGDAVLDPIRDQVEWVNAAVTDAVRTIQSTSERPPVIVIFSDHGTRLWPTDKDEMFRSLLLTSTPGHPDLFSDGLDARQHPEPPDQRVHGSASPAGDRGVVLDRYSAVRRDRHTRPRAVAHQRRRLDAYWTIASGTSGGSDRRGGILCRRCLERMRRIQAAVRSRPASA